MKKPFIFLLVLLLLFVTDIAFATHIVGGEVTYTCLGNDRYHVVINIYQDCLNGDPQAIAQDNPAFVSIFYGNGTRYLVDTTLYEQSSIRVPINFNNSCIVNAPNTCLNKVTFERDYTLPASSLGYYIVYQRCCRNANILNITNPGEIGATYFAIIPPTTICNNSALFKNYPPQIICINNPLYYDHSATDPDNDSLSYELCDAYQGGSNNDAKPVPFSINFSVVPYAGFGYSAAAPLGPGLGTTPALQINPTTGIITGTPTKAGRFVVTVCCHEWRNHVIINTVKREFQFVVTNCSKAVVANIPQYSSEVNTYIVECHGYKVHFDNLSTGGFQYHWDFGVPGSNSDTSNLFEPDFTYPDTGTFVVTLVVNRGSTCPDSISRLVKVYPTFTADFSTAGLPCPNTPIEFFDQSVATYKPINYWQWSFGDGTYSTDENPVHTFVKGGNYNVRLVSSTLKGCTDTASHVFAVEDFHPFAGNDTIIVKGESINFNATGGSFYSWTPSTYLSNPLISNPIGFYPDTTKIYYAVHIKSEAGCEGNDTFYVWVVGQASLFLPTAFSPNGDGLNDKFGPEGVGYRNINYFHVFNRWGQNVYSSIYLEDGGWDGTYGGKPCDIGTYFWELSINNRFGRKETMKGDVTLIR